jgi:hypothetical protein
MKISWRNFVVFSALVGIVILALIKPAWASAYLVDPFASVAWLFVRLIQAIDQKIIWVLLIASIIITGLWMIAHNSEEKPSITAYSYINQKEDRVAYWRLLFLHARLNDIARQTLQNCMEDLQNSIDDLAKNRETDVSEFPQTKIHFMQIDPPASKLFFIKRWLQNDNKIISEKLDESIDQILGSMETTLEINNDPTTNKIDHS